MWKLVARPLLRPPRSRGSSSGSSGTARPYPQHLFVQPSASLQRPLPRPHLPSIRRTALAGHGYVLPVPPNNDLRLARRVPTVLVRSASLLPRAQGFDVIG